MSTPTLYLFVGYPGAGKTTVARLIHEATGAVHIWADRERWDMFKAPSHSADESRQLYDYLNRKASELLADGKSVIFDTNFNYRHDRDHLRSIAAAQGAETVVVWISTPHELAKKRAVEESHGKDTRLWGNMPADAFERIAGHLEAPSEDENVIKIDGSAIDPADVRRQLGI